MDLQSTALYYRIMKLEHHRDIKFRTRRVTKDRVAVRAELIDWRTSIKLWRKWDKIHQMRVTLTLDPAMVIQTAKFETIVAPYFECRQHVVSAEKLIGLSLAKGFTKKAFEIYGGVAGCSHILTILSNLAAAVRQGFVFTYTFPEEEERLTEDTLVATVQRMGDFIADTCMVWKKDSAVQRDIRQGRLRTLPNRIYPRFARKLRNKLSRFR